MRHASNPSSPWFQVGEGCLESESNGARFGESLGPETGASSARAPSFGENEQATAPERKGKNRVSTTYCRFLAILFGCRKGRIRIMKRLQIYNSTCLVEWEDTPEAMEEAKMFRFCHPEFKYKRIRHVLRLNPSEMPLRRIINRFTGKDVINEQKQH